MIRALGDTTKLHEIVGGNRGNCMNFDRRVSSSASRTQPVRFPKSCWAPRTVRAWWSHGSLIGIPWAFLYTDRLMNFRILQIGVTHSIMNTVTVENRTNSCFLESICSSPEPDRCLLKSLCVNHFLPQYAKAVADKWCFHCEPMMQSIFPVVFNLFWGQIAIIVYSMPHDFLGNYDNQLDFGTTPVSQIIK